MDYSAAIIGKEGRPQKSLFSSLYKIGKWEKILLLEGYFLA
jgi:hypothetical protein